AHLHECGPRCVLEGLIAVERGQSVDAMLEDFGRVSAETFHKVGASTLPVKRELILKGGKPRWTLAISPKPWAECGQALMALSVVHATMTANLPSRSRMTTTNATASTCIVLPVLIGRTSRLN